MNENEREEMGDEEIGEAVLAYVAEFAERVGAKMLEASSPAEAVAAFVDDLRSDEGITVLLGRAFEDGRRDAMLAAARFAGDDGPSTTWEGVDGGERGVLWREGHACNTCGHSAVCVVARTIPTEMLVQVRRCLAYVDASG